MVALRAGPDGGFAPLALAVLIFVLTPTSAGYQDLGSLIAQQPQVAAQWREHLIASPFGTIHASMFSLPRPLGTGMPDPAGFRPAKFEIRDAEITGTVQPVSLREMPDPDPIVFPEVDRSHKGDLLVPSARPKPQPPDEAARIEPLPDELQAALEAPALRQEEPALAPETDAASRNHETPVDEPDAPDLSILEAAADPDPSAHASRLFFGGPLARSAGAIEPWAQGEEPILMLPRRPVDSDIKLSALTPSDTDPRTDAGVTIAGKGEVTGVRRPIEGDPRARRHGARHAHRQCDARRQAVAAGGRQGDALPRLLGASVVGAHHAQALPGRRAHVLSPAPLGRRRRRAELGQRADDRGSRREAVDWATARRRAPCPPAGNRKRWSGGGEALRTPFL